MTLKEMEAQLKADPPPREAIGFQPAVRKRREELESWVVEQLDLMTCPTCGSGMEMLVSPQSQTRHYTCTNAPSLHRWTIIER